MNGMLVHHRTDNPRWCDQCRHPSVGRLTKARWIWKRTGGPDIYLCDTHAGTVRGG